MTVTLASALERLRTAAGILAHARPGGFADPLEGVDVAGPFVLHDGEADPFTLEERLALLFGQLGLDDRDAALLTLCLLPELHPACAALFGALHDDPVRRAASPRLLARLLAAPGVSDGDVLQRLDAEAVLRRSGALRLGTGAPLLDAALTAAPAVLTFLLGVDLAGAGQTPLRRVDPPGLALGREDVTRRIASALRGDRTIPLVVSGSDVLGVLSVAADTGLVVLDAPAALAPEAAFDLTLTGALEERVVVIDQLDDLPVDGRTAALRRLSQLPCRPVLHVADRADALLLADIAVLHVDVPPPLPAERAAAWRAASGLEDVDGVAARFRLDVERIGEAVLVARAEEAATGAPVDAELLALGARRASSRRIGELAERLEPGPRWGELILPAQQLTSLHTLAAFLLHREEVMGRWGAGRGSGRSGLVGLFAGESGTGKTLAARVIAGESGLDVYRVDLAGLFSKWVGETEKNLDRIFRAAEGSNAVLFFDEADVVFGKRSSSGGGGANDRYANLETAYLLQRIEAYDGVVVLATNLRSSIDTAFLRRIDVVVDFPPPSAAVREQLWRALLPDGVEDAEELELPWLAERFDLAGGGIRNCTTTAAFLAAADGGPIRVEHLVRAIAMEYGKLGRLVLEADFEQFHALLR